MGVEEGTNDDAVEGDLEDVLAGERGVDVDRKEAVQRVYRVEDRIDVIRKVSLRAYRVGDMDWAK